MTAQTQMPAEREERLAFVKQYIREHCADHEEESAGESELPSFLFAEAPQTHSYMSEKQLRELNEYVQRTVQQNKSFKEALFALLEERNITYVQCYQKALVSKGTASKIKTKPRYKPSKATVVSFAIALQLNLEETQDLLDTVSMHLSNTEEFDVVIKAFITSRNYNIFDINETLYDLGLDLLGVKPADAE